MTLIALLRWTQMHAHCLRLAKIICYLRSLQPQEEEVPVVWVYLSFWETSYANITVSTINPEVIIVVFKLNKNIKITLKLYTYV